jgi:hypothetical protein
MVSKPGWAGDAMNEIDTLEPADVRVLITGAAGVACHLVA